MAKTQTRKKPVTSKKMKRVTPTVTRGNVKDFTGRDYVDPLVGVDYASNQPQASIDAKNAAFATLNKIAVTNEIAGNFIPDVTTGTTTATPGIVPENKTSIDTTTPYDKRERTVMIIVGVLIAVLLFLIFFKSKK